MSDLFGVPFDLPSFPHPDSFCRNVVPGPIPAPTLLTESVAVTDLKLGDVVLYINHLWRVVKVEEYRRYLSSRLFEEPEPNYAPILTESYPPVDRVRGVTFGLLTQEIPLEWLRDDSQDYRFGKFSSQLDEYCWTQALEQGDYIGSCDELGFVATRVDITLVNGTNYPRRTDSVIQQWADGPNDYPAGYIVTENDRGAVDVEFFDTVEELEQEWSRLQDLETELRGPDEDDVIIENGLVLFGSLSLDISDFDSEDEVYPLIRAEMERQGFYPNVWRISDHGNATIVDISEES